jgi:DNA-binding NarL/FixJ family response regulator
VEDGRSPAGTRPVRVLLADEQALFREAVRLVLDAESEFEVVAEAQDGLEAVAEAERTSPDVALLDAALPKCDGIQTAWLIRRRVPGCDVVIVTGVEDPHLLEQALEVGATGFITKSSPLSQLITVTRAVHRGETRVPSTMLSGLLGRLMHRRREQDKAFRRISMLTRREREVLRLLVEGSGTEAIARALVISPQTARTHIQNILAKLAVHSRLQAAALVNEAGIVDDLVEEPVVRIPTVHTVKG